MKDNKRVYTKATYRLRELHKNYKGNKSGNPKIAHWFDNTDYNFDTGNFYAQSSEFNVYWNDKYEYLTEQEFIEFMGLDTGKNHATPVIVNSEVFNPQDHYDNSKGSLYKVATDLGLNHWEFDIFKRLVRCRKKNQFEQDLQKIKDTIDIYLKEYDNTGI